MVPDLQSDRIGDMWHLSVRPYIHMKLPLTPYGLINEDPVDLELSGHLVSVFRGVFGDPTLQVALL